MDTRKAKTIRLDERDWQAIEAIKTEHGITSDSDAIRFALRMALREIEQSRLPLPNKERPFYPHG
jgi:Arc/MetJ-type ribon-helix-helix transcriptional regulator